jgi:hypothetical protein
MDTATLTALVTAIAGLVGAVATAVVTVLHVIKSNDVHQSVADDLQTIATATPGVTTTQLATPALLDGLIRHDPVGVGRDEAAALLANEHDTGPAGPPPSPPPGILP